MKNFIAALFTRPVDVVDRNALKPYVRPPAEGDAVYAF
jgi:predicted nucleotidyltransferase